MSGIDHLQQRLVASRRAAFTKSYLSKPVRPGFHPRTDMHGPVQSSLRGFKARRQLKAAVERAHPQDTDADKFLRGIAHAVIDISLTETHPDHFELQPVPFTLIGNEVANLTKDSGMRKAKLYSIMTKLSLQRFFTVSGLVKYRRLITANLPELLPHADSTVRALLPQMQWHTSSAQHTHKNPAIHSTSQFAMSESSQAASTHPGQLTIQQTANLKLPCTAILVESWPQPSQGQIRQLHIVQKDEASQIVTNRVLLEGLSQLQVMDSIQKCLVADMNIMFQCYMLAEPFHANSMFAPNTVFDVQIAEAILEQFDNFPDGSLCSRQRSLDTLLAAYDLTHQSTQMWQNGMLGHATVSPEVLEGMQLLELAEKQVLRLGKHGVERVLKLSQAWFRSAPQHTEKESATAFSNPAQITLNTDMLMEFTADHKPCFKQLDAARKHAATHKPIKQSNGASNHTDAPEEEVKSLLQLLPTEIQQAIGPYLDQTTDSPDHSSEPRRRLIEIVADSQRQVRLLFSNKKVVQLPICMNVSDAVQKLAAYAKSGNKTPFRSDNRMGMEGTLHRISAIRDHQKNIIGLTYRVGRHVPGVGKLLQDVLCKLNCTGRGSSGVSSLLLLGPPGVGTASALFTHEVLLEAVQNHTPEVIVVDEIGGVQEVKAVKTIAERGVVMVATAHGVSLANLVKNPDLNPLVGGICQVTISDGAAAVKGSKKTISMRRGAPVFQCLVEILSYDTLRLHLNVAASVDAILEGRHPSTQLRRSQNESFIVRFEVPETSEQPTTTSWLTSLAACAERHARA